MTAQTNPFSSVLYEQDYALWLDETAKQLKQKNFLDLDLGNLIEEIESIGRSERWAVESLLIKILVHLLKLAYWESEKERNETHWITEVATFRIQIKKRLAESLSLKSYVHEIFEECYKDAIKIVTRKNIADPLLIPLTPFSTLEQALNDDWFPW